MRNLSAVELALFFTHDTSLADWHQGGMLARELALYKELNQHLSGIRLVTYGRRFEAAFADQQPDFEVTYNAYDLPLQVYEAYLRRWFPLRKRPPDVIKSNQIPGADIALSAARRSGSKFIARCGYLHSHNTEKEHGVNSLKAQEARDLEARVFPAADAIVVTTGRMREQVMERYDLPETDITVIPNYVLTDEFAPGNSKDFNPMRICFVGRLSFEKGLGMFIDACEGLDVELYVVGNGALRLELEQQAQEKNVDLKFLGNVKHSNLPQLLRSCALFVLPSQYEGHPKALLEAMSCGLPVIGTDVPGIREIIHHRENGFLADPTVKGLRAAIQEVLSNKELRLRMAKGAREYVLGNLSLKKIVTLELALLESLF